MLVFVWVIWWWWQYLHCVVLNGRMIKEWWFGKVLGGRTWLNWHTVPAFVCRNWERPLLSVLEQRSSMKPSLLPINWHHSTHINRHVSVLISYNNWWGWVEPQSCSWLCGKDKSLPLLGTESWSCSVHGHLLHRALNWRTMTWSMVWSEV
jgi:hypothetical protein